MKKIATLAAVASVVAVMFVPGQASAESAELRIAGTITPTACTPVFTGGGVVDYGKIPAKSLNPTAQTNLPEKSIQLGMTCDAPVLFGFKTIDERAGTAVTSLQTGVGEPETKFGLGTSDGQKIGAYSMQIVRATADGRPALTLFSENGGTYWGALNTGGLMADGGRLIAFVNDGGASRPNAHKSVTTDIRVTTVIDKGSNLPLTHAIPLDGLSTFELVYL
ncbi:DUF1120 domain-containing protein [Variovorax sp. KBS0712]|uniref:DUF1120 domain-containing protein n=1 Tax=Variovorax sp. KBS0712 TaxID=2578111 RepID=UPI001119F409|nr:DUF1120 domain-containing protein [Variovorax sp. KBS0712]TSD60057.1 DUF1120 domain-containing protein [Variovorax sp. KBS0712]